MKYSEYLGRRKNTFENSYDLIKACKKDTYKIVELGTSRSYVSGGFEGCMNPNPVYWNPHNPAQWDWGAGIFTKVFSDTLDADNTNYTLYRVDPDRNANAVVTTMCGMNKNIRIIQNTSTNILNTIDFKIDFLYMDHMESGEEACIQHFEDSKILIEKDLMSKDGIILIDDVGDNVTETKGKYSIPYLLENGYELVRHEYQVLLKRVSVANQSQSVVNESQNKTLANTPKIIYFTWMKRPPAKVFHRWQQLNPNYVIDFSDDTDCISFLKDTFGDEMAHLFQLIPHGMYKADLWRLCKLYIHGGVYADIDIVPFLSIDTILQKGYTFCTSLSIDKGSMFQAFFVTKPKNPLLYSFIYSFLTRKPYRGGNGPTYDMYKCVKYSLGVDDILPDTEYRSNVIRMKVDIGVSEENTKQIKLVNHFPRGYEYEIVFNTTQYSDMLECKLVENMLHVKRIDTECGWTYNHSVTIVFKADESYVFFREHIGPNENWLESYITWNGTKILKSRDVEYHQHVW